MCLHRCEEGTSRTAVISTAASIVTGGGASFKRQHAVVYATRPGDEAPRIRCDVWVAAVHTMEIITVVEQVAVNTTEQVQVVAKDEFENTFSTLEVRLSALSWSCGRAAPCSSVSLASCRPLLVSCRVSFRARGYLAMAQRVRR
jgi:hypothetical protein